MTLFSSLVISSRMGAAISILPSRQEYISCGNRQIPKNLQSCLQIALNYAVNYGALLAHMIKGPRQFDLPGESSRSLSCTASLKREGQKCAFMSSFRKCSLATSSLPIAPQPRSSGKKPCCGQAGIVGLRELELVYVQKSISIPYRLDDGGSGLNGGYLYAGYQAQGFGLPQGLLQPDGMRPFGDRRMKADLVQAGLL